MKKLALMAILFSSFPVLSAPLQAPRVSADIVVGSTFRLERSFSDKSRDREWCRKRYTYRKHGNNHLKYRNNCLDNVREYDYVYSPRTLTTSNESHKEQISTEVLESAPLAFALSTVRDFAKDDETKRMIDELKGFKNTRDEIIVKMIYSKRRETLNISIETKNDTFVDLFNDNVTSIPSVNELKVELTKYILELKEERQTKSRTDIILDDFSNIKEEDNGKRFI